MSTESSSTLVVGINAQKDSSTIRLPTQNNAELQTGGDNEKAVRDALASTEITQDFGFLPIPRSLRHHHNRQYTFGLLRTIAFGFVSTFTSVEHVVVTVTKAPPLISAPVQIARSFNVSYDEVSHVPTLFQAGYAAGLVLISPLGDICRRRPLILAMVSTSMCLTVGIAATGSLLGFQILAFLVGIVGVTPPVLVTLAADIAPADKRPRAIAVVLSGLIFGILIARILGGIMGDVAPWRVVYYFAIGVEALVLSVCYFMLPDYPSHNKDLSYLYILGTMAKFSVTEPQLIQAIPITIASAACFSNFWVTITFLLGEAPYNYSTLVIGLFGFVGIAGVAASPFVARLMYGLVPWYAALIATSMLFCFQVIHTAAGGINIGAVVVVAFGIDVFRQLQHVAVTTAVFEISASARVRLNAVLTLSVFIGQVLGTAVGTSVFVNHGWRASALFSLGLYSLQLLVLSARGPHVKRYTWVGYEGGFRWKTNDLPHQTSAAEKAKD